MTVMLLTLLIVYLTLVYGPIAALLVELFPTRIRYTAMSLPYHIGNGWFGGFLPATVFAIVAATGQIYSGQEMSQRTSQGRSQGDKVGSVQSPHRVFRSAAVVFWRPRKMKSFRFARWEGIYLPAWFSIQVTHMLQVPGVTTKNLRSKHSHLTVQDQYCPSLTFHRNIILLLSGLWYPIVVAAISFVVMLIFMPETKNVDISNMTVFEMDQLERDKKYDSDYTTNVQIP
jgi:hypothetical protein